MIKKTSSSEVWRTPQCMIPTESGRVSITWKRRARETSSLRTLYTRLPVHEREASSSAMGSTRRIKALSRSSVDGMKEMSTLYPSPNLFLRCTLVPSARRAPFAKMPTRVQSISASSMVCVVRTIARPALLFSIICHTARLLSGSRPVVGSSRKITSGWPSSETASETRRFCPADRLDTTVLSRPNPR